MIIRLTRDIRGKMAGDVEVINEVEGKTLIELGLADRVEQWEMDQEAWDDEAEEKAISQGGYMNKKMKRDSIDVKGCDPEEYTDDLGKGVYSADLDDDLKEDDLADHQEDDDGELNNIG